MNLLKSPNPEGKSRLRIGLTWFQAQLQNDGRIRQQHDHPNGKKPKSRRRLKVSEHEQNRIRFPQDDALCQVQETITLQEFTEEEIASTYYSTEDLTRIFDRTHKVLQEVEMGNVDSRVCIRGLEKLGGDRQEACHAVRQTLVDAVMDLQEIQWESGKDDFEKIANECIEISSEATARARKEATQDTRAARHYLHDISYQKPDQTNPPIDSNNKPVKPILKMEKETPASLVDGNDQRRRPPPVSSSFFRRTGMPTRSKSNGSPGQRDEAVRGAFQSVLEVIQGRQPLNQTTNMISPPESSSGDGSAALRWQQQTHQSKSNQALPQRNSPVRSRCESAATSAQTLPVRSNNASITPRNVPLPNAPKGTRPRHRSPSRTRRDTATLTDQKSITQSSDLKTLQHIHTRARPERGSPTRIRSASVATNSAGQPILQNQTVLSQVRPERGSPSNTLAATMMQQPPRIPSPGDSGIPPPPAGRTPPPQRRSLNGPGRQRPPPPHERRPSAAASPSNSQHQRRSSNEAPSTSGLRSVSERDPLMPDESNNRPNRNNKPSNARASPRSSRHDRSKSRSRHESVAQTASASRPTSGASPRNSPRSSRHKRSKSRSRHESVARTASASRPTSGASPRNSQQKRFDSSVSSGQQKIDGERLKRPNGSEKMDGLNERERQSSRAPRRKSSHLPSKRSESKQAAAQKGQVDSWSERERRSTVPTTRSSPVPPPKRSESRERGKQTQPKKSDCLHERPTKSSMSERGPRTINIWPSSELSPKSSERSNSHQDAAGPSVVPTKASRSGRTSKSVHRLPNNIPESRMKIPSKASMSERGSRSSLPPANDMPETPKRVPNRTHSMPATSANTWSKPEATPQ